jgi:hypothetical protein
MDRRFEAIDRRFDAIDRRFETIDRRFETIDRRFEAIDRRFEAIETRIAEEGETTRRHFDVMVEKVESAVRVIAEGHSHLQTVVDDHEVRLQAVEKRH